MFENVRLVCFDLGGVIIRICQTWEERCAAAGLEMRNPELWDQAASTCDELMVRYMKGRITGRQFAEQFSDAMNGLYTPTEITLIHDAWLIDEYQGVGEIAQQLHQAGITTAALSNTTHEHWLRMDEFPTVSQLHHRFASHQLDLHKPDPAIYRHVEQQLERCPNEILFFDDTEENVIAAQTLGWRAHRIDPFGDPANQITQTLIEHGLLV